jgi:choline dehydrogenase-like flavoprotein
MYPVRVYLPARVEGATVAQGAATAVRHGVDDAPGALLGRLTPEEIRLRKVLRVLAVAFAVMALGYLYQGFFQTGEFPFVANSVAKDGFFAAMCVIAVADLRRFSWAVVLVIAGHAVLLACLLAFVAFGNTWSVEGTFASPMPIEGELLLWLWVFAAFALLVVVTALYESASRARYGLRYLSHAEYATVQSLAEVLIPADKAAIPPTAIAHNVDGYLASFSAKDKWKIRAALLVLGFYPLLFLRPPWAIMSTGMRKRFILKRFVGEAEKGVRGPIRDVVDSLIRAAQQMVYVGYYGDPRGAATAGYKPFSQRDGYAEAIARVPRHRPRLDVTAPGELDTDTLHADVAVVGSGAAGAILAYELAERGRDVVVLERGPHIDPSEFTEDEKVQISNLYRDGALQLSSDLRFSVLQGMCVGGTTVVNNAVCFDLPDRVLRRWNDADGLNAGIDRERLAERFRALREWLPVVQQSENGTRFHQAGARKFQEGIDALGLVGGDAVEANILDCLGSGYCNIGCQWGKKLSALDTTLPRAQHRFGTDRVRIVSECRVDRVERDGQRAKALDCTLADGRRLRVEANTIVVAAGALASSLLLQRSRIKTPAGRRLSFNVAAPLTVDFPERLDAYAGMQICNYVQPSADDGVVLETWFNPAMMQSLFMPGWFDDHWQNMQRYPYMTCFGVVVGSVSDASVKPALIGEGPNLKYRLDRGDRERLIEGMKLAGRMAFAAGALRVMPPTFGFTEITSEEQLDDLDRQVRAHGDLMVNSAHPQGGNPVSRDPERGVVDERFRVRHRGRPMENLYVADASVFPSSVTVNPQLTVMALASYAAQTID